MVVLPEPVGPGHQDDPVGQADQSCGTRRGCRWSMPTLSRSSMTTERSRIRTTTLSPNIVGKHADAEVDGVAADGQADAAVLRQAPLGDVQVGHDLDARGDGEGQVPRRRDHFVEHAVGPDADLELVLERLEVQVAGPVANRQQEHHVQAACARGAVGHGFGAGRDRWRPAFKRMGLRGSALRRTRCRRSAVSTLSPVPA